jgi:hypothetical protein
MTVCMNMQKAGMIFPFPKKKSSVRQGPPNSSLALIRLIRPDGMTMSRVARSMLVLLMLHAPLGGSDGR